MDGEASALGDAKFKRGTQEPKQMIFDNGSKVYVGYCEHLIHIAQHNGPEWDEVLFEEAVQFMPEALSEISTRDRGSATAREAMYALGVMHGRTRYLTNPGGRAANFLEDFCILKQPDAEKYPHYDAKDYGDIKGDITDNPYLAENHKTSALGSLEAKRYEQLAEGRWDVFPGQFFSEWSKTQHVATLQPEDAQTVAALVYSYNAVGVFLVARLLARGRVYVETEWKFQYQTIPEVAAEISKRIAALGLSGLSIVAPADLFDDDTADDGTVKAESPAKTFARNNISLRAIDADDYGWQRIHDYLRNALCRPRACI
jgi:hypothetical protein